MYFSLFISPSTAKHHGHYIQNKYKKTKKDGEKKANCLRNSVTKEWHGGEFLGFSFCLVYPRLAAEEANNSENTNGNRPKKKSLLSLTKGQRKGQPSKTENFREVLLYCSQIPQAKLWPPNLTHASKGRAGSLTFYPYLAVTRQHPPFSCQSSIRKKKKKKNENRNLK